MPNQALQQTLPQGGFRDYDASVAAWLLSWLFGGVGEVEMAESAVPPGPECRSAPVWAVLIVGLFGGFLLGRHSATLGRPDRVEIGLSYGGEVPVSARFDDGRVVALLQGSDTSGYPLQVFYVRPDESITFEATVGGRVLSERVQPCTLSPHLLASARVAGDRIEFRFRQPGERR
jgi:hypothetical protein